MVFSSIEFIFIFCPIFLLCYYLISDKHKNILLFAGSILFYTIGSPETPAFIFLLLLSLLINYLLGLAIQKQHTSFWFVSGITINLLYLSAFKFYYKALPLGISFYTFQAIAYLCDVRQRKYAAEHNIIKYGAYFTMFPYLISGPLVRYDAMEPQIHTRKYSMYHFVQGIQTFLIGLGSKVLLADQIAYLWRQVGSIGYESISTPLAWLGIIGYSFQLYFDFSGYSLMAMGLGSMLGFDLPINFNHPYMSTSMTEFWHRWHITLGNWFKDYLYIPLGGNRNGMLRTYMNLFAVWILTGIWHGVNVNFVLWGMFLFVLIAIEKAGLKKLLDRYSILGHLYMVIAIPLSWSVFAIPNWNRLVCFMGRLFGIEYADGKIFAGDFIKYGREYGLLLTICFLFATNLPAKIWTKLKDTYFGKLVLIGIFLGAVYFMYGNANSQFLYYQF